MSVVQKEIGTDSRDHSTVTLYHAATYGGATASDNAIGLMFNDSTFDEAPTLSDTTPIDVLLTVPLADRGDGTAATGTRFVMSTSKNLTISAPPHRSISNGYRRSGGRYRYR